MLDTIFNSNLYKKHREMLLCIFDLITVIISFILAYIIQKEFRFSAIINLNIKNAVFMIVGILIIYTISFMLFKIHKSLWKYVGPVESLRIGLSVTMSTLFLTAFILLVGFNREYISIVITAGVLTLLLMFNNRLFYRLYRRVKMKNQNEPRNAIIIGAGDAGYVLVKELSQNNDFNVRIVGFIDDKRVHNEISGYRVIGDTYDIPEIVQKYDVEVAFIAIPSATKEDLRRIYDICQSVKLDTKIMKESNDLLADELEEKKRYPVENISIEDLLGRGEIHLDQNELKQYLTGKVIAVTGAGGSIGSELCRQIAKFKPYKLIMIDVNENSLYMLEQEFNRNRTHSTLDKDIEIISLIASIREYKAIHEIFEKYQPDVVFHAAAHKHVPLMETRPMEAIKNNVFGTNNVIRACIKNEVKRFIMISTDKAVNPTNVMGATKRMTEMILQANGNNGVTKMAAVRFGNVLGSNGSVIPIFKKQIAEGGPVTITDKNIIRYFMTIPEAAQLVLQAGFYADKGEIFVLDMGQPVKILDLAEKMIRMSGLKPYKDIDIVEIGLRPGEKMFEELRLDGEVTTKTKNDLIFKNNVMSITKEDITHRLDLLSEVLNGEYSNKEIKERLLHTIISDKDEIASLK